MDLIILAEQVGRKLSREQATISTAESCTGGLVASTITDVSGSSRYFLGGIVAYSNQVKVGLLGVKEGTLSKHGAVSAETVREMAVGIQRSTGSTYALATSGIAGPEGGTAEKPVGLVYIGLAGPTGTTVKKRLFSGSRREVKLQTVQAALELLLQ